MPQDDHLELTAGRRTVAVLHACWRADAAAGPESATLAWHRALAIRVMAGKRLR